MTRVPDPGDEAERIDREAIRRFGVVRSLVCYLWPGLVADWYWPAGAHGRLWHLLHRRR